MSHEQDKLKNSKRRFEDDNAVKKQLKIAKANTHFPEENKVVREPHRLSKHHAMDCGNPECYLCGNPRKTHKDKLTIQEKRFYQDTDKITDKHSNGIVPNEKNEN
jgi:hypothetical protein